MVENKVCLVTGSTAGIGKGIAFKLLEQGATVFINGRSKEKVDYVIKEAGNRGLPGKALGIVADLSSAEGCQKAIEEVENSVEHLDVLVNNMGVFDTGSFFDYTDDQWLQYFNVNFMSTVRMCRFFFKQMLEKNKGRIIIVASEVAFRPIPDMIPYSTTKACQVNFARGLAELSKGTNVTVNSLIVGPTKTEGVNSFLDGLAEKELTSRDKMESLYFSKREPTSLIQRFLQIDEVANVAAFLASDLSSGINGSAQMIEGGIIRHI